MDTPDGVATPSPRSGNDELITIAGGVEIEVAHQDGSKEIVKVRQIPISKLQQYMMALGMSDTAEEIALYCSKPKDWVDALDPLSALAIAAKGQELNSPFVNAWLRHQAKWRKVLVSSTVDADAPKTNTGSASASSPQPSPTTTG